MMVKAVFIHLLIEQGRGHCEGAHMSGKSRITFTNYELLMFKTSQG